MSTLHGDDALASAMEEMLFHQGYTTILKDDQLDTVINTINSSNTDGMPRIRLQQLPDDGTITKGGEQSLEPHDRILNRTEARPLSLFSPTNPEVEICRRRAYEKFKTKFKSMFATFTEGTDLHSVWKELPAHSILERFHFACKLEEQLSLKIDIERCAKSNEDQGEVSTDTIRTLLATGKANRTTMDPVLLDPSRTPQKGKNARKRLTKDSDEKSSDRIPTATTSSMTQLLKDEVIFQMRREPKKHPRAKLDEEGDDSLGLSDMCVSKKFRNQILKLSRSISALASNTRQEFWTDLSKRAAIHATCSQKKKKNIPKIQCEDDHVSVTYSGLSLRINHAHYLKLQTIFHSKSNHRDFASNLFSLLCRYDMLEGAGLQSSLNGNVFLVLRKHYSCQMECFASPFNSFYERYCSAFDDTDGVFGALGSFFHFEFNEGCFAANPPFTPHFIFHMYQGMQHILEKKCELPLMFVVFVPTWTETLGWKALFSSPYLVRHLPLSQKENHFYCEGTQHRRKKRTNRVSSCDTSVFFLQNEAARIKWIVDDAKVEELRIAFCSTDLETTIGEMTSEDTPTDKETLSKETSNNQLILPSKVMNETEPTTASSPVVLKRKRKSNERKRANEHKKKKTFVPDSGEVQLQILDSLDIRNDKEEDVGVVTFSRKIKTQNTRHGYKM